MPIRLLAITTSVLLCGGLATAREVVMLDPGHGGTNRGAYGPTLERYEKSLTLELALLVKRQLAHERPDLDVQLTRRRDLYLTLQQRVRRANEARARLFLSLHFNASRSRGQQGFESYILTPEAAALEAGRLAARARRKGRAGLLEAIRIELGQSAVHGQSARLAARVQRALRRVRGAALDRGVKQSSHDVLLGLRMPAALVEVGFIDNADSSPTLARPATLRRIAGALASAISTQLPSTQAQLAQRQAHQR